MTDRDLQLATVLAILLMVVTSVISILVDSWWWYGSAVGWGVLAVMMSAWQERDK